MSSDAEVRLTPMDGDARGRRQVHLVGFMGCGKSTVGPLLARRLLWSFLDLDALIVRHAGRPVAELFAEEGEQEFRRIETFVLRQAAQKPHTVVALGGGAHLAVENRELSTQTATSVWLRCSFAEVQRRVNAAESNERGVRPLWTDPLAARSLFEQREAIYAGADLVVDAEAPPDEVAAEIEAQLRA
ncbi:MAG TPA: shikimate kinase [Acidobacteriota bacterium]|nr:shikimate kinase [Acidobacteriota bacterium]